MCVVDFTLYPSVMRLANNLIYMVIFHICVSVVDSYHRMTSETADTRDVQSAASANVLSNKVNCIWEDLKFLST